MYSKKNRLQFVNFEFIFKQRAFSLAISSICDSQTVRLVEWLLVKRLLSQYSSFSTSVADLMDQRVLVERPSTRELLENWRENYSRTDERTAASKGDDNVQWNGWPQGCRLLISRRSFTKLQKSDHRNLKFRSLKQTSKFSKLEVDANWPPKQSVRIWIF